ncbi:hypothetical protein ACP70R_017652 [Stipagrostis hirtigluma subsp. patula]
MASSSTLIALLVAVSCAATVSAETFIVGDGSGWTTGFNYDNWASGKTFKAGDTLVFNYGNGLHDVVEVTKNGYDSCSISNAIKTDTNGPTTVTLQPGTHYYICGIPGHCSGGMKLAVTVDSGSGSGSPAAPGTPAGTPSTPRPSGAAARMQAGPALAVAAGVLVKLALF